MALSIREKILAAFFVKLDGIAGLTAYRNRDRKVSEDKHPAVVQRDGGLSRAPYDGVNIITVTLRIDVEVYVTATTDEALGAAISDAYAKVTAGMLDDSTLGGLTTDLVEAEDIMSDPLISNDQSGKPHAAFNMGFNAIFQLNPTDPYTPAP